MVYGRGRRCLSFSDVLQYTPTKYIVTGYRFLGRVDEEGRKRKEGRGEKKGKGKKKRKRGVNSKQQRMIVIINDTRSTPIFPTPQHWHHHRNHHHRHAYPPAFLPFLLLLQMCPLKPSLLPFSACLSSSLRLLPSQHYSYQIYCRYPH